MITTAIQILAIVAVLANAVVYGTDIFAAVTMRSVYTKLDDSAAIAAAGWGHYFGDKRMPIFGAGGVVTAVLTTLVAASAATSQRRSRPGSRWWPSSCGSPSTSASPSR
jgi:hypothetical protein